MAFVPWKDRVTATPHRYKLTEVAPDTYDLEAVPGAISEAGTPVNATYLDKLIQRDGDDIKDTVVAFTEAGARANIATGESTATLFGKIKKYFTDLKTHAFTAPSTTQGTGTTSVPCDNILKESSFARVYREATEITGITYPVAIGDLVKALSDQNLLNTMLTVGFAAATETKITGLPQIGTTPQTYGMLTIQVPGTDAKRMRIEYTRELGSGNALKWIGAIDRTSTPWIVLWKQIIDDSSAQTITSIKTYSVSPLVPTTPSGPSAAVAKVYADSIRTVYDRVIRTQAEFDALIASATWLDATSVAIVGQFTLSTTDNSGVKIPATVKQIHGFNSAKITVTNFAYDLTTAKGGLWYATAPTTQDYSIRDLEVSCTSTGTGGGYGFSNCKNLSNCTGTGTGIAGGGFSDCNNLSNCTGTGTGTGTGIGIKDGYGFSDCNNLSNCTGTGTSTGTGNGYGFSNCKNLSNCTGTGTSTGTGNGYGFYKIDYAVNCKNGGYTTDMWAGANKNIDLDTCCKTPVEADNTVLNANP